MASGPVPLIPPFPLGGVPPALSVRSAASGVGVGTVRGTLVGAVAVLASCAVVLGTFLDWVRAEIPGIGILGGNGWHNIYDHVSWGPGITAAAVAAAVLGSLVVSGFGGWLVRGPLLVAGVVEAGLVAAQIIDVANPAKGVTASGRTGLWVMAIGAGVTLIAAVFVPSSSPAQRAAMVTDPRAVGAVG